MHIQNSLKASRSIRTILAVGLACALHVSCDSTARFSVRAVQFESVQVLGAVPVKKEQTSQGEIWVPACGGDATGVQINFNLKSTARIDLDKDTQIRPEEDVVGGTIIRIGDTISKDTFDLSLDCASPHSGADSAGTCGGTDNPSAQINDVVFVDHLNGNHRGTPVGVAVLIDHTGSTNGSVDGTKLPGAFRPTCLEGKQGSFELPESLNDCVHSKGLRLTAAEDLVGTLNDVDPAIVFSFNEEDGVQIVCNIPGLENPDEATKALNCYTTDRRLSLGGDGLPNAISGDGETTAGLQGGGKGRSNLWTAVQQVSTFMGDKPQQAKHLVIIADGPDTCHPTNTDFQYCFDFGGAKAQEPCPGAVAYEAARTAILEYQAKRRNAGLSNDLHISFIHYQTYGYVETDPRMQEIACLTGGTYQFLNTNTLAENSGFPRQAFSEAVSKVRLSLGGHWGVVADIPAYLTDSTQATLGRGQVHALEGVLTLGANDIVNIDKLIKFGFGNGGADQRLPIVKACQSDADCGTGAGEADCGVRCDPDTHTCNQAASGSSCGANTGLCCEGACRPGSELCTTPQLACP